MIVVGYKFKFLPLADLEYCKDSSQLSWSKLKWGLYQILYPRRVLPELSSSSSTFGVNFQLNAPLSELTRILRHVRPVKILTKQRPFESPSCQSTRVEIPIHVVSVEWWSRSASVVKPGMSIFMQEAKEIISRMAFVSFHCLQIRTAIGTKELLNTSVELYIACSKLLYRYGVPVVAGVERWIVSPKLSDTCGGDRSISWPLNSRCSPSEPVSDQGMKREMVKSIFFRLRREFNHRQFV